MEGSLLDLPAGLRGNYAAAQANFTLPQDWAAYAPADHATWRTLFARQAGLLPRHAAAAYRAGWARLDFAGGVPYFSKASDRLRAETVWALVAVPGLIPDAA